MPLLSGSCKKGHIYSSENTYLYKGRRLCRTCRRENVAKWTELNRDKVKITNAKSKTILVAKKFGVSVEEIMSRRSRPCEICGSGGVKRHGRIECHVDHNHTTGQLRGSLCESCNQGLGKFKDSKELLLKAANYLKEYEYAAR